MQLLSIPRIPRRVVVTWLALFFLVNLIFLITGQDTFATGLIPLLSTFPFVVSNGALASLIPDIVVSSPTAPLVTYPHPAPIPSSHWVATPKRRWVVSYVTSYDDETLYNIRHRRPLNGTAKFVTRGIATTLDFDDFASSPVPDGSYAGIETPVYSTLSSLGLIGFPDLELASPVDDFPPLGFPKTRDFLGHPPETDRRGACLHELFAPLLQIDIVTSMVELPPATIAACDSEDSTSADVLKRCSLVAYLAIVLVIVLPILVTDYATTLLQTLAFRSRTKRAITRLVSLYDDALVHIRTWIFKLRFGFEWIVACVTQLLGLAGLPPSDSIHDRLLALEESLALQRAQRLPLDPSTSQSNDSFSTTPSAQDSSALDSELNKNFDRIMEALNKRLDRDNKPAADPPFLSPAWVERSRAGTLSFQTNSTSSPTVQTRPQPKSRRVPFGYYDLEHILQMKRLASERRTTLPPLEPESGASEVSPPNPNGRSTTIQPDLYPTVAPTTSPATPSNAIATTSSHTTEKNLQDSTPAPGPSALYKSDTDLAAQVSGAASHARFLGTSRLGVSGDRPDPLTSVQTTTASKESFQVSRPNEPQKSDTDLAAQVSGTASYARCFGVSRPEPSFSVREDGASACTRMVARNLKPRRYRAAGTDLSAQGSEAVPNASLLGRTRLDLKAALASSRHTAVTSRPHLNVVETQAKSGGEVEGSTTRRQGIPPDSVEKRLFRPSFSSEASTFRASSSQAVFPTGPQPDAGGEVDVSTSTSFEATADPPLDAPALVASPLIVRKATERKKMTQKKVVTFSEDVQVRDLPMSEEDIEARLSLMPSRRKRTGSRKSQSREEKQPEGESGMDWEPTPMPAAVIAQGPGNDVAAQGFSIVQQPILMEEWQMMAASSLFGGAGTNQVQGWPLSGLGWRNLGAFQGLPPTWTAMEQPQDPIPMDVDVEMEIDADVEMLPYSLPQPSLQGSDTPAKRDWLSQVRRELCGITWQRQYTRRRIACFGF